MNTHPCPKCGAANRIVNECGCDPNNLPTRVPTLTDVMQCAIIDSVLQLDGKPQMFEFRDFGQCFDHKPAIGHRYNELCAMDTATIGAKCSVLTRSANRKIMIWALLHAEYGAEGVEAFVFSNEANDELPDCSLEPEQPATPSIEQVLADPCSSKWLKDAVPAMYVRDCMDFLHDAELLLRMARANVEEAKAYAKSRAVPYRK